MDDRSVESDAGVMRRVYVERMIDLRIVPTIALLAAVSAASVVPRSAVAQFQQRASERVLFLVPEPVGQNDSAYALEFTEFTRRRMDNKLRHRIFVLQTEQVCEMLTESGYTCGAILGPADADRLARALQADAYITGTLAVVNQVPQGTYRMVDIGRSGLSGWMTVHGSAGAPPRSFAEAFVDSLSNQVRAAENARECSDRRDRGDYRNAIERAERAFQMYPNHPSAAMCAAVVFEAQQQSTDNIVLMLERATKGDSLLQRAWERLGRLYQELGDSLQALAAFRRQLELNPTDRSRWLGVIAGYITVGQHEQAQALADDWLGRQSGDLEFLQLKARACSDGELWDCALSALSAQFGIDSMLARDTVFYPRIIGAAQEVRDTVAALRWTGEAVRNVPGSLLLWRARATALQEALPTDSTIVVIDSSITVDSVVAAYEHILMLAPNDVRSALAAGRIMMERVRIDTLVPLDTARLFRAEGFLDRVTTMSQDTSVLMNVSAQFAQPGIRLARIRRNFPVAIRLLEKSNTYNVRNLESLSRQTNFFLGFALMFQIFEFDQQVTASESCALVEQEADMIRRGSEALTKGAELSPNTARQLLQQYRQFQSRVPTLREAYKC